MTQTAKREFTEQEVSECIDKALAHYAYIIEHSTDDTDFYMTGDWSVERLRSYLEQRGAPVIVYPGRSGFEARGTCQSLERGLNNLRDAINGYPGHQWLWYWIKQ